MAQKKLDLLDELSQSEVSPLPIPHLVALNIPSDQHPTRAGDLP